MSKTRVVETFSARNVKNDDLAYGVLTTTAVSLSAFIAFHVNARFAPEGFSAFDGVTIPFLVVMSLYIIHNRVSRNMKTNEENRLEFSRSLRSTVNRKLYGQVRLEDVHALATGHTLPQNGFSIWLQREGRKYHLMTDKPAGVGYYAMKTR